MRPDQDRLRALLTDTITCLCRNGLQFNQNICIQGLLGITLDNSDVFIVHINEVLTSADSDIQPPPVSYSEKQLRCIKPVRRFYPREGVKQSKKFLLRANHQSRSNVIAMDCSIREAGDNSLQDSVQHDESAGICPPHTDNRVEEPIEIKSEPDVDAVNINQLLDADVTDTGHRSRAFAKEHGDLKLNSTDNLGSNTADSHLHIVTNRTLSKHSLTKHANVRDIQLSSDQEYDGDVCIPNPMAGARHSYPGGFIGETGWSPGMQQNTTSHHTQLISSPAYEYTSVMRTDHDSSYSNPRLHGEPFLNCRRRPVASVDKKYVCSYDGCGKMYYERKNLLKHQSLKHGRPKVGRRQSPTMVRTQ